MKMLVSNRHLKMCAFGHVSYINIFNFETENDGNPELGSNKQFRNEICIVRFGFFVLLLTKRIDKDANVYCDMISNVEIES